MKTEIIYKCRCMQDEASLNIRARRAGEDIADWMEQIVVASVTQDHAARSPLCQETAMEYLKLPVPEDGRHIGESPESLH